MNETAYLIAVAQILAAHTPGQEHLVPPDTLELALAAVAERGRVKPETVLRWVKRPWVRWAVRFFERRTLPGVLLHFALRKRAVEDEVRRALAEGCRRVTVLGAGLDPLSWRLHREFPEVTFLEIDRPGTLDFKWRVLNRLGFGENLKLVPQDLALKPLEFAGGLAVAEGLLMYLPERAVTDLLERLRGGRLIFSFIQRLPSGRIALDRQSSQVDRGMLRRGEPMVWGLPPHQIEGFLRQRGWRLLGLTGDEEWELRYRAHGSARGEFLAVAESQATGPGPPR